MKKTKKRAILASIALIAMVALAVPVFAAPGDRNLPAESEPFWTVFAAMNHPTDTDDCLAAVTSYVNQNVTDENQRQREIAGMSQMCTDFASMPSQMQSDMESEGAATNLFDNTTDWHHVNNLYFQKTENGQLMGKISFSETIDFMSYDFMSFMNNFGNLVQFNDGYISLNASMIPQMINYGTTFTMYGLHFNQTPDIYVSNGTTMRKAIEGTDLSGISYDVVAGTLTFTPGHFSSFKAVEKGSTLKIMQITKVDPKSVKYKAKKSTFTVNVKGRNLYKKGSDISCTLGNSQASKVSAKKNGKRVKCTFLMSEFTVKDYYPLTISIIGNGSVTKTNAVRIK